MNKTQISVFKELLGASDIPYYITLEKCVDRIKNGASKSLIENIRKGNKNLKKKLPCIIPSGKFKERNKKGLISHSGLMVLDFDGYEDETVLKNQRDIIIKNKYIVCCFISPSGNGLKAFARIPETDIDNHSKYFKEFEKEFNYEYFDKNTSDVSRICFESYDPNIYVNYNAEVYSPKLYDEGFNVKDKVPLIPINDEFTIIEKIMAFNWKKDFVEGERNNYIFDLSGAFCEYGVSESTAIGYLQNNVTYGDFSEKELQNTIRSAYKKRQFDSKYFEDYHKIESVKVDLKKGKKDIKTKYSIDDDVIQEIKEASEAEDFWTIDKKGKISVIPLKYKFFLERNGFKKHFPNDAEKPQFVFVESNKVEPTTTTKIKDFVLNYLMDRKEFDVWNYCANYQNLFIEHFLLMLESIDLMMISDTIYKSFISFNNGILEITPKGSKLIDFIDVEGYVWKSHIIPRDWANSENDDNDYKKFINNISDSKPLAIECAVGYLLSNYKNRSNNKAIILNDEVISDNPEGGTGKGLFVQGIGQIRKTSIIDGKQFDSKKSFAYQTVSLDTKILVFDDVKKNFDFEDKFSLVTEGLTLERKNKDAVKLNVHDSPKLVISTNYAIKGSGNSHKRRRHELEIAQYYGDRLTPAEEFGKQLFDDWDDKEYNRFDNYMVNCLIKFFNNGLISQNAKNIKIRQFFAETSQDFYDWINDPDNFTQGLRTPKVDAFDKFKNDYQDYKQWLKAKTFNIWCQKYAKFKGLNYDSGNTNGQRWFCIGEKDESKINTDVPF